MKELILLVKKYWQAVLLCAVAMVILNIIYGSVCYSVILFGIPCPGCGITRATRLMLTGHFKESFQMHPLLILVVGGVVLYPILKKVLKNYRIFMKSYVIICVVIFVGFYIYRMKMYYPNVEPMVYKQDNLFGKIRIIFHELKQLR